MAEITKKVRLCVPQLPNWIRHEGGGEASTNVRDLDAETLSELCDEWRAALFAKCEKMDPRARCAPLTPPEGK